MAKTPSTCIGVCKFKREGHCIGCSMSKPQKTLFKKIKKEKQRSAFIKMLVAQQLIMGRYKHWRAAYLRKCLKKGVKPVDEVKAA